VALFAKFIPCFTAAKLTGFNLREAGAIGSLMSCKGSVLHPILTKILLITFVSLVELIVLNVGLSAGVLDTRTFSMFVVHAIIVTFLTTPLTLLFYPERVRVHEGTTIARAPRPAAIATDAETRAKSTDDDDEHKNSFALILDKVEQLPAAMALSQLLQSSSPSGSLTPSGQSVDSRATSNTVTINALRLIELTNRVSAVFKSQEAEHLLHNDTIVSVIRTFGYLNRLIVSAALSVVSYDEFSSVIAKHVKDTDSQMVIVPWPRGATTIVEDDASTASARNPFDGVFHKTTTMDQTSSVVYSEYIRKIFLTSPADVALFVDRGTTGPCAGVSGTSAISAAASGMTHLFLPFFGGPDDRLALNFVVQLCVNGMVSATVVRIGKRDDTSSLVNEKIIAAGVGHSVSPFIFKHAWSDILCSFLSGRLWQQRIPSTANNQPKFVSNLTPQTT
jgi:hypothetical protein